MSRPLTHVKTPNYSRYSEVIDVRSPSEFAEDHVPGAINLWVLDDEQRAEVGTMYKQVGAFEARKVGSALMARNIAHWLETHFDNKDKDYNPLVYCWRGGQRSEGMATILSRVTWDTHLLEGGYKNYRAQVLTSLETLAPTLKLKIISGLTGSGKTVLLEHLKSFGEQVIDLEGLANHRGSLLGHDLVTQQPSQKYFESLLAKEMSRLDPERVTWVEAESNKIGNVHCPLGLWQNMKQAARVRLNVSLENRVEFLLRDYAHFVDSPELVKPRLKFLRKSRGQAAVERWESLLDSGQAASFVEDILLNHYDIGYTKSIAKNRGGSLEELSMNPLDPSTIHDVASQLVELR